MLLYETGDSLVEDLLYLVEDLLFLLDFRVLQQPLAPWGMQRRNSVNGNAVTTELWCLYTLLGYSITLSLPPCTQATP